MRENCSRQNMVQRKGQNSSSRQRTCCGKQRREVFRQFSPDGKNKKATEVHLRDHDIGEQEVIIYDRFALKRHDYTATKAERMRYSQNWVLTLNAEGKQPPRQSCPDYEEAERECQRLQDEFMEAKGVALYTHPRK